MAISVAATYASATSKVTATINLSLAASTVTRGQWIICVTSSIEQCNSVTLWDNATNKNVAATLTRDANSGTAGAYASIWSGYNSTDIVGGVLNCSWTNASGAKVVGAYKITGLTGGSAVDQVVQSVTGSGVNARCGPTGTLSQADEICIACSSVNDEVDDAHGTITAGTSNISGNEVFDATNLGLDNSNSQLHAVAEIVSATTAQSFADDGHDSSAWGACIATYMGVKQKGPVTSSVIIGVAPSASRTARWIRSASTLIGSVVSAVATYYHPAGGTEKGPINSSVIVGLAISSTRALAAIRSASTIIGLLSSSTRQVNYTRKAFLSVGAPPIVRDDFGATNTYIDGSCSCSWSGTITRVQIYAFSNLSNCEVATFYKVGNNFSTRDTETIGSVTSGSIQTFTVDLTVQAGDYIGCYFTAGGIYKSTSGSPVWIATGDQIPCTDVSFGASTGTISLIGFSDTSQLLIGCSVNASRTSGFIRTASTVIGEVVTATRLAAYIRSSNVAVGVAVTASRLLRSIRSSSVAIGLSTSASRLWRATRSSSVIIGLTTTASKVLGIVRSASTVIGVTASASRRWDAIRTSSTSIGITTTASRISRAIRSAGVIIGVTTTASRLINRVRNASTTIGILVTASKNRGYTVTSSVIVGVKVSASRLVNYIRSAAVVIGVAVQAIGYSGEAILSSVIIGVTVSASRTINYIRAASVAVGLTISASRILGHIVNAAVTIGALVSASRIFGRVRQASVIIGVTTNATRKVAWNIASAVIVGVALTASATHASALVTLIGARAIIINLLFHRRQ